MQQNAQGACSIPEVSHAAIAAAFAFSSLPRLLNMKVCKGLMVCMAANRISDVLASTSRMCMIAVSTRSGLI